MNSDKVYCNRCPLTEICWGNDKPDAEQPADKCPLARLVNGDVKIETSGYISLRG